MEIFAFEKNVHDRQRKKILITLGWGWETNDNLNNIYNKILEMPNFHSLSLPLINIIDESHNNYFWLIRIHPAQKYLKISKPLINFLNTKFAKHENVEWINTSNMPLPLLLMNTNLHLTFDSSVTIDAALFKIFTGIIRT